MQLKQQLTTEPKLQELAAQYVLVEIKVGTPEFKVWTARYKPTGKDIPMVFIVGADGTEIYNRSGAPRGDSLRKLLLRGIQDTGGMKDLKNLAESGRRDKKLLVAVRNAKRYLSQKNTPAAVAALAMYLADKQAGDGQAKLNKERGSFVPASKTTKLPAAKSPATKAFDEIVERLTQQGRTELDKAIEKLDTQDKALLGVVALLKARRLYGKLPALAAPLEDVYQQTKQDTQKAKLFEQVEMIDKARAYEDKKNRRAAISTFRNVVSMYPDTLAAQLSQKRIDQLSRKKVKVKR